MDDVALANYIAGTFFGPVNMGNIDSTCANPLGVKPGTEIWFSDYTFLKLKERHGEINFSHYRHMPSILLRGFLARGRKPNLIELWWADNDDAYFVVLKATRKGEVFVETFHREHLKDARRVARKTKREGRLIRIQAGCEDFLIPRNG